MSVLNSSMIIKSNTNISSSNDQSLNSILSIDDHHYILSESKPYSFILSQSDNTEMNITNIIISSKSIDNVTPLTECVIILSNEVIDHNQYNNDKEYHNNISKSYTYFIS